MVILALFWRRTILAQYQLKLRRWDSLGPELEKIAEDRDSGDLRLQPYVLLAMKRIS